jgi:hypothetical protein
MKSVLLTITILLAFSCENINENFNRVKIHDINKIAVARKRARLVANGNTQSTGNGGSTIQNYTPQYMMIDIKVTNKSDYDLEFEVAGVTYILTKYNNNLTNGCVLEILKSLDVANCLSTISEDPNLLISKTFEEDFYNITLNYDESGAM